MKIYDELIHAVEGVRMQCLIWWGEVWNIYCNDRFEPGDFEIKVYCEVCGPKKYVPKVIDIKGVRLCKSCLTRFSEMLEAATISDCGKSRHEKANIQQKLIAAELIKKEMKNELSTDSNSGK